MSERRVFLAHAKGVADDDVAAWQERVRSLLQESNAAVIVKVTTARDDYLSRAKQCGGWNGWMQSCAATVMGEPRFHAFIVPIDPAGPDRIGRATAQLLVHALAAKRRVAVWRHGPSFFSVIGVREVDRNDWVAGCGLDYATLGNAN